MGLLSRGRHFDCLSTRMQGGGRGVKLAGMRVLLVKSWRLLVVQLVVVKKYNQFEFCA